MGCRPLGANPASFRWFQCSLSLCMLIMSASIGIHYKASDYDGAIGSQYQLLCYVATCTIQHQRSFLLYFTHFSWLRWCWLFCFNGSLNFFPGVKCFKPVWFLPAFCSGPVPSFTTQHRSHGLQLFYYSQILHCCLLSVWVVSPKLMKSVSNEHAYCHFLPQCL